jgi:GNAT superfamily N-acetyltransferase
MRIRPANRADIPALLPLAPGLIEVEQHLNTWALTEAIAGTDWVRLREPDVGCLLAEDADGTLVGMASYYVLHAPPTRHVQATLHVNGVLVLTTHRRRHIGTDLVRALASEAGRRGCGPMVWQVPDGDPVAPQFSARLGARMTGDPLVAPLSGDAVRWLASGRADSEAD